MASAVVYDHVAEGADVTTGGLFEGYKFWVAQRVPSRLSYVEKIKANGGRVVLLEKQADWLIADHFRRASSPAGSISYEFIDNCIKKGELLDPDNFPAGPPLGTARDPGSLVQPAKSTRAAYTPEEDRQLHNWVRDAQVKGIAISGNELYKQLEQQNPRHTWQSWRDRYLKKLQYMPTSAFSVPENAPPSPPSDQSSRAAEVPVVKRSGLVKNKDKVRIQATDESTVSSVQATDKEITRKAQATNDNTARKAKATETNKAQPVNDNTTSKVQATNNNTASKAQATDKNTTSKARAVKDNTASEEYNVDQLAATFSTRDWEELYAFVDEIDSMGKHDTSYQEAWQKWAEKEDNQTAEQWRQYYEKVVRPQWGRDSASKRAQVRERVMERHKDDSPSPTKSQSWSQTQEVVALQEAGKTASFPSQRTGSNVLPAESTSGSEVTAQPRSTTNGHGPALKRTRDDTDADVESAHTSRLTKVRRTTSASPVLEQPKEVPSTNGLRSQSQAIVIDLGDESESEASDDNLELLAPLPRPPIERAAQGGEEGDQGEEEEEEEEEDEEEGEEDEQEEEDHDDLESIASSTDLTHIAPLPRPPRIPEDSDDDEDSDNLPSNDPTPRANKHTNFNTQAILSPSQSQPYIISRLPRPPLDSSPLHHPDSEASTTQSLQEFSSYLQDDPAPETNAPLRLPRPASPTPSATSTASDSSSADPDPPLAADEMEDFFHEQHTHGFSDAFITAALKRTRFRPGLATTVLEAWRAGQELPEQRGVWSVEEDELVERGDGKALGGLEGKHTLDGWGGITERMNFLRAWAGR